MSPISSRGFFTMQENYNDTRIKVQQLNRNKKSQFGSGLPLTKDLHFGAKDTLNKSGKNDPAGPTYSILTGRIAKVPLHKKTLL